MRIKHKIFGAGFIVKMDSKSAVVKFDNLRTTRTIKLEKLEKIA